MFLVPWREYTLVGVWHKIWNDKADAVRFDQEDLLCHLNEINQTYPGLDLGPGDVLMWNAGLLPFGDQDAESDDLSFGKRSSIIDHKKEHGIAGLVSLIGVRYTMGRVDAGRALDLLLGQPHKDARVATDQIPVFGGDIPDFEVLVQQVSSVADKRLERKTIRGFVHNHGSNSAAILDFAGTVDDGYGVVAETGTLRAEVYNAVRNEMAVSLSDVLFRRTDIATGGDPGMEAIEICADILAAELNWDGQQRMHEIGEAMANFPTNPASQTTHVNRTADG
jgi:glycerol-3-phosphate dehydrogenase